MSRLTVALRSLPSYRPRQAAPASAKLKRSTRAAKQLMLLWLSESMRASADFRDGLDVACGYMSYRPLFQTQTYTGIDINEDRLAKGLTLYPDASAAHCPIEDMTQTADFVICLQTIGFNQRFGTKNIMLGIEKLIEATRPGGTLIFNIGISGGQQLPAISERVRRSFDEVTERRYGALRTPRWKYAHSMFAARAMNALPFLRGKRLGYFECKKRRPH